MNWGHKIIFAFAAFMMFLGVLVYKACQSQVQLVSPDYYKKEIAFQEQINKIDNERALDKSVHIEHDSEMDELRIIFPVELQVEAANVNLYRPSDASMDRKWDLQADQVSTHTLSTKKLASGLWIIQVEWRDRSKSYFKEQNIYLP
jgi:hypothetical protein